MTPLNYQLRKKETSIAGIKLFKEAGDKAYKTLLKGHLMLYYDVFPDSDMSTKELEEVYVMATEKMIIN